MDFRCSRARVSSAIASTTDFRMRRLCNASAIQYSISDSHLSQEIAPRFNPKQPAFKRRNPRRNSLELRPEGEDEDIAKLRDCSNTIWQQDEPSHSPRSRSAVQCPSPSCFEPAHSSRIRPAPSLRVSRILPVSPMSTRSPDPSTRPARARRTDLQSTVSWAVERAQQVHVGVKSRGRWST